MEGGKDTQWDFPNVRLTALEKKKVIATVVQIGVILMFNSHIYQFGGQFCLYRPQVNLRCGKSNIAPLGYSVAGITGEKWSGVGGEREVHG